MNKANKSKKDPKVITLHRYFIWCDRMRIHFHEVHKGKTPEEIRQEGISEAYIESFLYMSYWYGGLYVLIEGWEELGLNDPTIDALLENEEYVAFLRRYRNGAFHYKPDYYDQRFQDLWKAGDEIVKWIRDLQEAFSKYFLAITGDTDRT